VTARGLLVLVGVVLLLFAAAAPALADHEVEFKITGFGDQDCRTGSGRLSSSSAGPFSVEVCVTLNGEPLPSHVMTAKVTHGDGTTQEIPFTTDEQGMAKVLIEPVAAGLTLVEICDADGCDYGSVEAEADEPPPAPAVASYGGPTSDMGAAEVVDDGEDDFIDAYTADTAEPGSSDPSVDIASYRYLGVGPDGKARFEITFRGDACSVFTDGAPFAQLSVRVQTPDGGSYFVGWRYHPSGTPQTNANSEGAPLDGVTVELEDWTDETTGVLAVSGVDVPAGSTVSVEAWVSFDPLSSGFWDSVSGTPTPAAPEPEPESTTTTTSGDDDDGTSEGGATPGEGSGATTTTRASSAPGTTSDPGGSSLMWVIITGLSILLFVILYWWFVVRPKQRMYRADRWGSDLEIIKDDPEPPSDPPPPSDPDEPLVLEGQPVDSPPGIVEEPDTTFEDPCWEQQRKLDAAQDRLRALEAEQRDTDPSSETARQLDRAIDNARDAVGAAQKLLDECVAAHAPATPGGGGTSTGGGTPPGTAPPPEPTEFSKDCKEEEAAYAAARQAWERAKARRDAAEAAWLEANSRKNSLENKASMPLVEPRREAGGYPAGPDGDAAFDADMARYQEDLAAKEAAQGELAAAQQAEEAARAERDAAVAAQDAAWDAENNARMALDACLGRSSEPTDPGTGSGGGGDTGGGTPGIISDPEDTDSECVDGDTRWKTEGEVRRFTVLAGDIKLQISNAPASWGGWMTAQGSANSVTAAALLTLTSGEMEDLLDPLPDNRRVIPRATIPVRTATVRCQRKYECSGGRWVRTDEMRKNSSESEVTTETIGGRPVSTVGNLVDFLESVQSFIRERQEELDEGQAIACQ
jgi:hypothetical protein